MTKRSPLRAEESNLTDGELLRFLRESPWEQAIRESQIPPAPIDSRGSHANDGPTLVAWLCDGLVARSGPRSGSNAASHSLRSISGVYRRGVRDEVAATDDEEAAPHSSVRRTT